MLWPLYPREITPIRIEYGSERGEGNRSKLFGEEKNSLPVQIFEPQTGRSVKYIVQNFDIFAGN